MAQEGVVDIRLDAHSGQRRLVLDVQLAHGHAGHRGAHRELDPSAIDPDLGSVG